MSSIKRIFMVKKLIRSLQIFARISITNLAISLAQCVALAAVLKTCMAQNNGAGATQ
jgi:hypothetical protein